MESKLCRRIGAFAKRSELNGLWFKSTAFLQYEKLPVREHGPDLKSGGRIRNLWGSRPQLFAKRGVYGICCCKQGCTQ